VPPFAWGGGESRNNSLSLEDRKSMGKMAAWVGSLTGGREGKKRVHKGKNVYHSWKGRGRISITPCKVIEPAGREKGEPRRGVPLEGGGLNAFS